MNEIVSQYTDPSVVKYAIHTRPNIHYAHKQFLALQREEAPSTITPSNPPENSCDPTIEACDAANSGHSLGGAQNRQDLFTECIG